MKPAKTPTVLIPIDFSPPSGAGLRFALQWAIQQPLYLVCLYIAHPIYPTANSDPRYRNKADGEKKRLFQQMNTYVNRIARQVGADKPCIALVLIEAMSPDIALEEYCHRRKDIDYVCIGTKGASGLKKLYGTHAGNLIMHSNIPVIAVPVSYRRRPITRLLYASDLSDYTPEIRRLLSFAGPLKTTLRTLHLNYLGEVWLNEDSLRTVLNHQFHYPIDLSIVRAEPNLSVTRNLQRQISIFKPSMVAVFTSHHDSPIQRILYPGVAETLSFQLKMPLLVFPRTPTKPHHRRRPAKSGAGTH